jgi:hypothetical protein
MKAGPGHWLLKTIHRSSYEQCRTISVMHHVMVHLPLVKLQHSSWDENAESPTPAQPARKTAQSCKAMRGLSTTSTSSAMRLQQGAAKLGSHG